MDYNNLDLRNKTFLDFTDDAKIINKIIGSGSDSFASQVTENIRAKTFMFFAEMIEDKKLSEAIRKEFAEEVELMFNE